jgi:hypothetical protein
MEAITLDKPASPGANRLSFIPSVEYQTRSFIRSIGTLLHGILGTTVTTVGSPNSHLITPADDVPYHTAFARQDSNYYKIPDARIDELVLEWEEAGPLAVSVKMLGLDLTFLGAAFTITNNENWQDGIHRAAGGTFKVDTGSGVPATAKVKSGRIALRRNLTAYITSEKITPENTSLGVLEGEISTVLVPDNLDEWRKIVTGTAGGTSVKTDTVYGSFEHKFVYDATNDLKLEAPRVPFVADFPEADAAGGVLELELVGGIAQPSAGDPFKATLRNAFAGY